MLHYSEFELLAVELLFAASLVAIAAKYAKVPYTAALVVVGFFISLTHVLDVELNKDLIFLVFLPPLLFEGAINMNLVELRRRWAPVALLAVPGTAVTAAIIALALVALTGMKFEFALLLAVMLAPTDPVSVLITMKQHGVPAGLRTIIEGESIFNDAVGIVLFGIAYSFAFPDSARAESFVADGVLEFIKEAGLGVFLGIGFGYGTHHVMRLIDDYLIEITLSVTLAFASFLVAEQVGGSGVLAVVVGGLLIGNYGGYKAMSAASQTSLVQFWEVVAFLVNSALFLLIGLQFDIANLFEVDTATAAAVAVLALFVARAVSVYGLLWLNRQRLGPSVVPRTWQHAIVWGGLRGSIPIALALGLSGGRRDLGGVDAVAVVFACVFVSLIGQGLTFAPLLRRLGLMESDSAAA